MSKTKYITPKVFMEEGYLQEVNRQFLHPLGLALQVTLNTDAEGAIVDQPKMSAEVWDCRDEAEGIHYSELTGDRLEIFKEKARNVAFLQNERRTPREEELGFWIQPIEGTAAEVQTAGVVFVLAPDIKAYEEYIRNRSKDVYVYLIDDIQTRGMADCSFVALEGWEDFEMYNPGYDVLGCLKQALTEDEQIRFTDLITEVFG